MLEMTGAKLVMTNDVRPFSSAAASLTSEPSCAGRVHHSAVQCLVRLSAVAAAENSGRSASPKIGSSTTDCRCPRVAKSQQRYPMSRPVTRLRPVYRTVINADELKMPRDSPLLATTPIKATIIKVQDSAAKLKKK